MKLPNKLKNNGVIVLGMHRSGTSAITGCLNLLGIEAGFDLIGPDPSNTMGYWEKIDLVMAHDALLNSLDMAWDSVGRLPEDWISSVAAQSAKIR
jgi:hypothetical protein